MKVTKIREINFLKLIVWLTVAVIVVLLTVWVIDGFRQDRFDVSFYNVKTNKVTESVKIVMISDLHNKVFGKNNDELISKIKDLSPDMIVIAGDMNISGVEDYSTAVDVTARLVEVAPVYYGYGNHEFYEIIQKNSQIGTELKETGANVLSNQYINVDIKSNNFAIGAMCASPDTFTDQNITKFLAKYDKAEGFKLLISHYPEIFKDQMEGHTVDLALCGHAHGGQIILPFIGGLYSKDQGFFPKLTENMQTLCGSTVIISRGLGNSSNVPRFNNNPEIVVINITRH